MPKYVKKALDIHQHTKPKRPQYAPHRWTVSTYGKRLQMAPYKDDSELLGKEATKRIHYIVQTMLYYSWSVDPNMLRVIKEILRVQLKPTRDT